MPDSVATFASNWDYLSAEMKWLERVVRAQLLRAGQPAAADEDSPASLRGLYLSEAEVQRLLEPAEAAAHAQVRDLLAQAAELRAQIAQRREATLNAGVPLYLPLVGRLFGLNAQEEQLLVIALAPELDPRYEKFYAYLNDDLTRRSPTLQLALALLFEDPLERVQARALLAPDSRLLQAGLLRLADNLAPAASRAGQGLQLDERIADLLLGVEHVPGPVRNFVRRLTPAADPANEPARPLAEAVRQHLERADGRRLFIDLHGPAGVGKRALAQAVCGALESAVLVVDLEEMLAAGEPFEPLIRLAAREALLQPAALYLEGLNRLLAAPNMPDPEARPAADRGATAPAHLNALARALEDFAWLTFLAGERAFAPVGRWREQAWLHVPLAAPDESAGALWWASALAEFEVPLAPAEVDALAGRFRFAPGQIRAALQAARDAAALKPPDARQLTAPDIARACRRQAGPALSSLAQHLEPHYSWEDIVLPRNALQLLHEICAEVRHGRRVYGDWGFGQKYPRGRGVAALFSGPSGTGKTMAAEIIAGDLELDLYRIDLSAVVSKYIGETEKNLAKVFAEAERASAVLFFDEADALFGKRSEVKDAHDRYANIEISYLLQRIESYAGVVIMATNLKKNVDDAFLRRLQFMVEFPFPDAVQRAEIWRRHFPAQAPRAPEVDFEFLAGRLALAGGNIKNVVRHAAFMAAADGGVIGMPQLMRAAKREYDKIGRLGSEADFGLYWDLIKAEER